MVNVGLMMYREIGRALKIPLLATKMARLGDQNDNFA
jgi:hypothetical protein